jgi:UDP-glucuronate decarboxylase
MIRWIAERLGTAPWSSRGDAENATVVDARTLVDQEGNVTGNVRRVVDTALAAYQSGRTVVVCCDYGMSRSNAVAAGVLALAHEMPIEDAVERVLLATGERNMKVEVIAKVRAAISGEGEDSPLEEGGVLITGGRGFLGSALAPVLRERGLRVLAPGHDELDLLSGAAALDLWLRRERPRTVVHLATPHALATNDALGPTLVMLKNVLDACAESGARLVYLSSWVVFSGYASPSLLASETLPLRPRGTYGQTKALAEAMIAQFRDQRRLEMAVVRASPVYGAASERPLFIRNFIDLAGRGEALVTHRYSNGFPALDLMHVDDAVDGIARIVAAGAQGTYHLGTGTLTSTAEIARIVVEELGSPSSIHHTALDHSIANVAMDFTLAKDTFGWQPRVLLRDGLTQLIEATKARETSS